VLTSLLQSCEYFICLTKTEEENGSRYAENSKLCGIAHFCLPVLITIALLIKAGKERTGDGAPVVVSRLHKERCTGCGQQTAQGEVHRLWSADCTRRGAPVVVSRLHKERCTGCGQQTAQGEVQ
jgi:ferredoxin